MGPPPCWPPVDPHGSSARSNGLHWAVEVVSDARSRHALPGLARHCPIDLMVPSSSDPMRSPSPPRLHTILSTQRVGILVATAIVILGILATLVASGGASAILGSSAGNTNLTSIPNRLLTLHRALDDCPVSTGSDVSPSVGPALGVGPVYPVGFGNEGSQPLGARSGSLYQIKVLWFAAAQYAGPIQIRGAQLDIPGSVTFILSGQPAAGELLFPPGTPGVERTWPSLTLVGGPGCFAYQVDGIGFSIVDVFLVTGVPSTGGRDKVPPG